MFSEYQGDFRPAKRAASNTCRLQAMALAISSGADATDRSGRKCNSAIQMQQAQQARDELRRVHNCLI